MDAQALRTLIQPYISDPSRAPGTPTFLHGTTNTVRCPQLQIGSLHTHQVRHLPQYRIMAVARPSLLMLTVHRGPWHTAPLSYLFHRLGNNTFTA